ncbi:hypothetical protein C8Q75DRAFT_749520 [Abortiporus biennis]|nr:hypothetical protein C8Q75DRAFT_749520 [Abortiporus biennis]
MSLSKAGRLIRPLQASRGQFQRRWSSSHAEDHHHHAEETAVAFPKEGFSSVGWRYFILFGLFSVGFYKFAPSPSEENYVTEFLKHYATPREVWSKLNLQHLVLSAEDQEGVLLTADAKLPPVHRYRFPQSFEQHSAHLRPVGTSVDLSDLVVKKDTELP